ncbi:MAG: hypothetical protein P8L85_17030, partial [Rubripirellula sp.]|nr:hypothetical protein [Rubripirellula sp.]
ADTSPRFAGSYEPIPDLPARGKLWMLIRLRRLRISQQVHQTSMTGNHAQRQITQNGKPSNPQQIRLVRCGTESNSTC